MPRILSGTIVSTLLAGICVSAAPRTGITLNGTTNDDRTLYFETLPANQLALALFLEGDRMKSLDITKANLDNQRNAVQAERRR